MEFKTEYNKKIKTIDDYISVHLSDTYNNISPKLIDAMRYCVLNGGKRLRSILCTEICQMLGGDVSKAMPFAAAIELIHAYSLVHDDLPAMDDADMRRGQPSCHKKYGEAMAILCGDALLNAAYELMSQNCNDSTTVSAFKCISSSAGAKGMINGQVIDLSLSDSKDCTIEELVTLIEQKTMALIKSAIMSGAYIAECNENALSDMEQFAYHLGLAFQIRDDFEDILEDSDSTADSPNFVNILGTKKAKEMQDYHSLTALKILEKYKNCDFLVGLHKYLFI